MKIKKCCKDCMNKSSYCSCSLADQCYEFVDNIEDYKDLPINSIMPIWSNNNDISNN